MSTSSVTKCVCLCGLAPTMFMAAGAMAQGVPTPPPIQVVFEPPEFNDVCVGPFSDQSFDASSGRLIVNGKLEKRLIQDLTPDTWLCAFDKFGNIVANNDNDLKTGNGKGSSIWSSDGDQDGWADILSDNGDGTFSLRLGVTGFPDGFDGNCDGFFMNAPHGQIGQFCATIEYADSAGGTIRIDTYTDEFITGAEAFRLNFTAPAGAANVHINIDNTCGRAVRRFDVDFMCFTGLQPLKPYCFTIIGGLDMACNPTDTELCWIDKNCDVVLSDDDSGPAAGYSQLCVIADINGNICMAVSGGGDDDCDGLVTVPGFAGTSPGTIPSGDPDDDLIFGADDNCPWVFNPDQDSWICDPQNPDNLDDGFLHVPHGQDGTYTLEVHRDFPLDPTTGGQTCVEAVMASKGDVNMDGIVDASDLVRLLTNWGVITTP